MKAIFTNNAVSELTQAVAVGDLTIYINDSSRFPSPVVGEEYFMATLVGGCDDRVEIVRVIENCGSCLRLDRRGAEDTTAQVFNIGDGVFHAVTAELLGSIINSWQWYLGPFEIAPTVDNNGYPLQEGHLYFQLSLSANDVAQMMAWDGSAWRPFSTIVGGLTMGSYAWQMPTNNTGPFTLPWPDTYGQMPVDFIEGEVVIDLYMNGSKLVLAVDPVIMGDYTIDYDADTITVLHDSEAGDVFEAKVLIDINASIINYIKRDEIDASGFGFVRNDMNDPGDPLLLLPTVRVVEQMLSAQTLDTHLDVSVPTPVNGQVLIWDAIAGLWIGGGEVNIQTPTLEDGWIIAPIFGAKLPAYWIDIFGVVHLEGLISSDGTTASIFTLPAGFNPDQQIVMPSVANGLFAVINIKPDGLVAKSAGDDNYVNLNGITFRAEPA